MTPDSHVYVGRNKGVNVAATGITQLLILKPPVAQKKRNESNETKTRRLGREESERRRGAVKRTRRRQEGRSE